MSGKSDPKKELELRPDGWERFDRAVTAAAKSGPKHRTKPHAEMKIGKKAKKRAKRKKVAKNVDS
jgi:hypothetical protein